jgi:protein-tyrosine phosphatase
LRTETEKNWADLHSHLLPCVDDGSKSIDQSITVLGQMAFEGTTDVCLTPHLSVADLIPSVLERKLELHAKSYDSLRPHLPEIPRTHRGVELMIDQPPPSNAQFDERVGLAGSRYVLVEFPPQLGAPAIRALLRIVVSKKQVPLIAHAERYLCASVAEVFEWKEIGAAVQLDSRTIALGSSGRTARARAIVEAGLADVIAADNHGDDRTLVFAYNYLVQRGGAEQACQLLSTNPLAVISDRAMERVTPLVSPRSLSRIGSVLRFFFGKKNA